MDNIYNPMHLADIYKVDHRRQYPKGTTGVYSNFTPRGTRIPGQNRVVFFGLQAFLKQYQRAFDLWFARPEDEVCADYQELLDGVLGPNDIGTDHIRALHRLGYLPLRFCALPEGTPVPLRVPMFTVENTLDEFSWLPNYVESVLSTSVWGPCTSATLAWRLRGLLDQYAVQTGDEEFVAWQGHDFSMRGLSSVESGAASGAGHLLSFTGSDSLPAIDWIKAYYPGDNGLILGSVPASEHSVMCAHGKDNEIATFEYLLDLYPTGIVSIVSDTWSLWTVLTEYLPALRERILAREGRIVIRPDCYDDETSVLTNSGWKLFSDLNEDDLVAQVHVRQFRNEYEFVKPIRRIEQDYNGYMVRFTDEIGKCDLLVTPNHRMLWQRRRSGDRVIEAGMSTVGGNESKMYRTAGAPMLGRKLSSLDRFRIAFQADGSFPSKISEVAVSGERSYRFNFSKKRKIDRLTSICENGGFRYEVHTEFARDGQKTIYVWLPADIVINKELEWVDTSDLCREWSREFIQEVSYWDACRRTDSRFKFDTTTFSVIKKIELIAIAAGFGVLLSSYEDDREDHFSDVYTAHILMDNLLGGQAIQKKYVWYTGKIHCVTVPSGMLLIKRNRATAVCGNSGNPADIVCGVPLIGNEALGPWECKGVVELLWDEFGGTVNSKGFKVLDSHVGVIYGDSISYERAQDISERLIEKGFASTNIVYGVGSYTYQLVTRDVFQFAMKATWAMVDGEGRDLFKDPVTDDGMKRSATGRLAVLGDELQLIERATAEQEEQSLLRPLWVDGKFIRTQSFADVRAVLKGGS